MFPVVEHFISINGEGTRAGELALFVRFKGCGLNCSYCDTAWAKRSDAPAEMLSAEDIAGMAAKSGIKNVTLTGGEPLMQKDIAVLVRLLRQNGSRVEIETNGSIPIEELAMLDERPAFTMDYKLPSSGMEKYMCLENFRFLCCNDTVKFVSGSMEDLERAQEIIEKYSLCKNCHVYISPVFGRIDPADIVEFMKERRLNHVRLQLQLHKFIWDPQKRGV